MIVKWDAMANVVRNTNYSKQNNINWLSKCNIERANHRSEEIVRNANSFGERKCLRNPPAKIRKEDPFGQSAWQNSIHF